MFPSRNMRIVVLACLGVGAFLTGCVQKPTTAPVDQRKAFIDASSILRQAAEDPESYTRAHAIEALSQTVGQEAGPVFKQALSDPTPPVRFAAAMAIGDVQYEPALPVLQAMAQKKEQDEQAEPDKRVFCAVIYALHRLGDSSQTTHLGQMLFDAEKEVRANAALVMGKMGEPSASVPLETRYGDEQDPSVQMQLVESLAILGNTKYSHLLEAYTKTQFLEDRLVAISAMERVNSPRAGTVLKQLLDDMRQPPRVRVAAAGTLARLGEVSPKGYTLSLDAVKDPKTVINNGEDVSDLALFSLQRLAAIALGQMRLPQAIDELHPLLESRDGGVRVAAAMSILRLLEIRQFPLESTAMEGPSQSPEPVEPPASPTSQPAGQPAPRVELYTSPGKD